MQATLALVAMISKMTITSISIMTVATMKIVHAMRQPLPPGSISAKISMTIAEALKSSLHAGATVAVAAISPIETAVVRDSTATLMTCRCCKGSISNRIRITAEAC